jgi:protein transport protein SEC31
MDKHQGPVRGLAFNYTQGSILASAGEDSSIYVWNLQNPEAPVHYAPEGKNPHANQIISALAWNKNYESIMATTSHNGLSVVWDLKQKKPLVTLANPNSKEKRRYSSLAWSPDEPTHLVVGCEDDSSPYIEYWDLRRAYEPLKEFKDGHQKGILALSWCPDDGNILLSSGKDNRVVTWNPTTGEILGEFATSKNWMFDVAWSYKPTILATSSYDGVITISSMQDSSSQAEDVVSNQLGIKQAVKKNASKTAPKWLKRPVGACFGFGGKFISFNSTSKNVTLTRIDDDLSIGKQCQEFETLMTSGDYATFCSLKSQNCPETDVAIWNVLGINFESDPKEKLMKFLGFNKESISQQVAQAVDEKEEIIENVEKTKYISDKNSETLLQKALMVGNYESAVEVCFLAGRLDDALLLSTFGGGKLWEQTRTRYLNTKNDTITKLVSHVLGAKLDDFVANSDLNSWKETLATICAFGKDKLSTYSELLAKRLETEKFDASSSLVCYIVAQNVEKVISMWLQDETISLFNLMERVVVLTGKRQIKLNSDLIGKYAQFGHILAENGFFKTSLHFLNLCASHGYDNESFSLERWRVYHALDKPFGEIPKIPFAKVELKEVKHTPVVTKEPMLTQSFSEQVQPRFEQPRVEQRVDPVGPFSGSFNVQREQTPPTITAPVIHTPPVEVINVPPMRVEPQGRREEREEKIIKSEPKQTHQEPITIQFDVSKINVEFQPIASSLTTAFELAYSGNVSETNLSKRRMIESGLTSLYQELVDAKLNSQIVNELLTICNQINNRDFVHSDKLIKTFSTTYWDEAKSFSKGLKFLNQILKEK